MTETLLTKLLRADIVCKDCGTEYGKYSVGCSSTWMGTCDVCGEAKPVTEVRDYGYLSKGIREQKEKIKEQSKEVAMWLSSPEPIMSDDELENELTPCYEQGEIVCKFTEAEVNILSTIVDLTSQDYPPGKDVVFDSLFEKITNLYDDHCVKYELSPALKAYNAKYGTWGTGEDQQRWEGFRDAFVMLQEGK
jgi:hypothetical protein